MLLNETLANDLSDLSVDDFILTQLNRAEKGVILSDARAGSHCI